jgi:dTDP-4-amino-4,6-dideoxygalactose transaminase
MFYLQFSNDEHATQFKGKLNELEIGASSHYQPLGNSLFMQKNGFKSIYAENSYLTSKNLVRLPLWFGLSEVQIERVFVEASAALQYTSQGDPK